MKQTDSVFDELLMLNFKSGDNNAFRLLLKRWNPKVFKKVMILVQNKDAAEDIVQETWHAVLKSIDKLKDPKRFGVYLLKIASYKSYDWIKSVQKDRQLKSQPDLIKEIESADDRLNMIRSEIRELEPQDQMILSLFYTDGYSVKEIASILSIKEGTVKSRLYYAREKLKSTILKGEYYEDK